MDKTQMYIIIGYAIILASIILIPTVFDIFMAYRSRNRNWDRLIEKASQDGLDKEELQALIKATADSPPGISGMSRSLMAFAVIVILGIAVFHLMGSQSGKYDETIKNVLSMLAATLASITGFYFGGRSAEEKKGPAPPSGTAAGEGATGGEAAGGTST